MLERAIEADAVEESTNTYLQGWFAPVTDELDVTKAVVEGQLPAGLEGTYVRNGPNPQFLPLGSYTYPFDGDGMIHAVHFEGGRAKYRNRWIVTRGLAAERRAGHALYGGTFTPVMPDVASIGEDGDRSAHKNWSNAGIVRHLDRILSLWEGGYPYELTKSFGTVGEYTFGGALPGAMTAHPKLDPVWDELCWFRYDVDSPYLVFGVIGPRGNVTRNVQIDIPRPVLMHDFGVTDQHVVFFDSPAVLDPAAASRGEPMVEWRPEHGTRIGVLSREGGTDNVRWFPVENRFVLHVMNAYCEGESIIVDSVRRRGFAIEAAVSGDTPKLYRSVIDLGRGTVSEEVLDDRAADFPRIDDRRAGLHHRYGYVAAAMRGVANVPGTFDALLRYDFHANEVAEHRLPEGTLVGEPQFVPRPGRLAETDGWVLAFTYDPAKDSSTLVVIAADDFDAPPLAVVRMPRRVPAGQHGTWLPAA